MQGGRENLYVSGGEVIHNGLNLTQEQSVNCCPKYKYTQKSEEFAAVLPKVEIHFSAKLFFHYQLNFPPNRN